MVEHGSAAGFIINEWFFIATVNPAEAGNGRHSGTAPVFLRIRGASAGMMQPWWFSDFSETAVDWMSEHI